MGLFFFFQRVKPNKNQNYEQGKSSRGVSGTMYFVLNASSTTSHIRRGLGLFSFSLSLLNSKVEDIFRENVKKTRSEYYKSLKVCSTSYQGSTLKEDEDART